MIGAAAAGKFLWMHGQRGSFPARTSRTDGVAVQLFRLFPARFFHHLRKTPVVGDAMLRAIDALLPHDGFVLRRVRAGPLVGTTLELDPRALDMVIGRYETAIQAIIEETLQEGDVAVDIGAHLGYFTFAMAAAVGAGGRVVSCEPDPVIMGGLQRNLWRNAARLTAQVVPLQTAVGAKTGRGAFARGPRTTRGRIAEHEGDFEVQMLTLADVGKRFGPPALVKIDVEGAEREVLEGGIDLLRTAKPTLLIETHSPRLETDCTDLLRRLGYSCTRLAPSDRRETYVFAGHAGQAAQAMPPLFD